MQTEEEPTVVPETTEQYKLRIARQDADDLALLVEAVEAVDADAQASQTQRPPLNMARLADLMQQCSVSEEPYRGGQEADDGSTDSLPDLVPFSPVVRHEDYGASEWERQLKKLADDIDNGLVLQ